MQTVVSILYRDGEYKVYQGEDDKAPILEKKYYPEQLKTIVTGMTIARKIIDNASGEISYIWNTTDNEILMTYVQNRVTRLMKAGIKDFSNIPALELLDIINGIKKIENEV